MALLDGGNKGELVGDIYFPTGVQRHVLDKRHKFYTMSKVFDFLFKLPAHPYVEEYHDCDDFAQEAITALHEEFPGIPVGFASGLNERGQAHAVIILFTSWGRIYYDPTAKKQLNGFNVSFILA